MRIAFIAPFGLRPKATVSARMVPMAQALALRGHTVRIVVPPWDDHSARSARTRIEWIGDKAPRVQLITLGLPRGVPRAASLTFGLVKESLLPTKRRRFGGFNRLIHFTNVDAFRPDIVHVFKPIGYSGMAALVLSALRVPWVLDMDDWDGPGGWLDVNPYTRPQKVVITLLDALLPRMARAVTTASRALERRTWDMGVPRNRVFNVPNGVSSDRYASWQPSSIGSVREPALRESEMSLRERLGLNSDPVILLYTRLAEYPYWWPLDVLRRVLSDHPQARLLVVGSGFFGEEEELRAEAERIGLGWHVVVVGRVPEEHLPAYLSLGDVALYPMADNLITRAKSPVKVLEPMLMGRAIVAHRVGQAAEFLADSGMLVEPGDLAGMGAAVADLLHNTSKRAELGRRALERVWTKFNWDELCLGVEAAYKSGLGSRN